MCVWGGGGQLLGDRYVYILPSVNNKDNIRYFIVARPI